MFFGDVSIWKFLVLGLVAFFVFGPDRLPELARDAGRMLRQLRRMASEAKSGLKEQLGPEAAVLENIDLTLLNPKAFVRKHLLEDDPDETPAAQPQAASAAPPVQKLREGERAPFDPDAT